MTKSYVWSSKYSIKKKKKKGHGCFDLLYIIIDVCILRRPWDNRCR